MSIVRSFIDVLFRTPEPRAPDPVFYNDVACLYCDWETDDAEGARMAGAALIGHVTEKHWTELSNIRNVLDRRDGIAPDQFADPDVIGRQLGFVDIAVHCDGEHAAPECADPQCWHRDPPLLEPQSSADVNDSSDKPPSES